MSTIVWAYSCDCVVYVVPADGYAGTKKQECKRYIDAINFCIENKIPITTIFKQTTKHPKCNGLGVVLEKSEK